MSRRLFAVVVTTVTASCLFAQAALAGINFVGAELVNISPKPDYMLNADFNNDGRQDIVVVSPASNEINVYLADNSTSSHFAPGRVTRFGQTLRGAAVGDINNDGRADVLVTDQSSASVWILLGRGDGTFSAPYQVSVDGSRNPVALAIANFDKSGNDDLVVADRRLGRVFILLNDNNTQPRFRRGGEIDIGEEPVDVRTLDLDGDGNLDILTLNIGGPKVKEVATALWTRVVSGFPDFGAVQHLPTGENPSQLVVADFNNDSQPDIAMLNRPSGGGSTSEINVMLGVGGGVLNPPTKIPVPCPFFTGGQPCKALALTATDADRNGNVDLLVALTDPRRTRGSASSLADALQAFSGQGDGSFVPGGVFATQKAPAVMVAADLNGDHKDEIIIANDRTLDMQAFINVSSAGGADNGTGCFNGDECLSNRCLNGVCCATACDPDLFEFCAVPGREGTCVPVPPTPMECGFPQDPPCTGSQPFCVDNVCCDQDCDGQCNTPDFPGVCLPGADVGEICTTDTSCKRELFCSRNFVCCSEPCQDGFCDDNGVCHTRTANGGSCAADEECLSNVCDEFDLLCCNRRCNTPEELCWTGDGVFKGQCVSITFTPPPDTPTPTITPTKEPTLAGGAVGSLCSSNDSCDNNQCVTGVCCSSPSCPTGQHCAEGSGACVAGTAPPTITPTPSNECGSSCPANQCVIQNGVPRCLSTSSSSGGCSVGAGASDGNLIALALLPLALWTVRRFRLQRVRVRSRAPRQ